MAESCFSLIQHCVSHHSCGSSRCEMLIFGGHALFVFPVAWSSLTPSFFLFLLPISWGVSTNVPSELLVLLCAVMHRTWCFNDGFALFCPSSFSFPASFAECTSSTLCWRVVESVRMVAVAMGYEGRPRRARVMLITEYSIHWRSKGKDDTLSRSLPFSIRLLLPCQFSATAHAS